MPDNSINIIRFSAGYWPDLLFTIKFTAGFLLSGWPVLMAAMICGFWINRRTQDYLLLTAVLAVAALTTGFHQFTRLDFSLEALGYMIAASSAIIVYLLIAYLTLKTNQKIWSLLPAALICGLSAAILTVDLHLEVEKFTYFSEKLYQQITFRHFNAGALAGTDLALLSFGIYIGLAEEFFKFLFLLIPFWTLLKNGTFTEILLLTFFVSAGFAIYENIIYAYNYGVNISIIRNLFNGHLFFAMCSAWLFYWSTAFIRRRQQRNLALALLVIPLFLTISLLHGIWDYVAIALSPAETHSYILLGGCYFTMLLLSVRKIRSTFLQKTENAPFFMKDSFYAQK